MNAAQFKQHLTQLISSPQATTVFAVLVATCFLILAYGIFSYQPTKELEIFEQAPIVEEEISFTDLEYKGKESFTVKPGESWVEKKRSFVTTVNDTQEDIPVQAGGNRKWLCHGICPDFEWHHNDSVFKGEYGPGTKVKVGRVAILDDDDDNRVNQILLNSTVVHSCEQGLLAPPCEYTLKENESGSVHVKFRDSIGIDAIPVIIPHSCQELISQDQLIERGKSGAVTCTAAGTDIAHINFRMIDTEAEVVMEHTTNADKTATWEFSLPIAQAGGQYSIQCQICNSENNCTQWGAAE